MYNDQGCLEDSEGMDENKEGERAGLPKGSRKLWAVMAKFISLNVSENYMGVFISKYVAFYTLNMCAFIHHLYLLKLFKNREFARK